ASSSWSSGPPGRRSTAIATTRSSPICTRTARTAPPTTSGTCSTSSRTFVRSSSLRDRVSAQLFSQRLVELAEPARHGSRTEACPLSEVGGVDHHPDALDADERRKHEQIFGGVVAYGEATDGDGVAVDHDVAAEVRSAVGLRHPAVEFVRIVQPQREVKPAVRVERLHAVSALGNLAVAFPQLGTGL